MCYFYKQEKLSYNVVLKAWDCLGLMQLILLLFIYFLFDLLEIKKE